MFFFLMFFGLKKHLSFVLNKIKSLSSLRDSPHRTPYILVVLKAIMRKKVSDRDGPVTGAVCVQHQGSAKHCLNPTTRK